MWCFNYYDHDLVDYYIYDSVYYYDNVVYYDKYVYHVVYDDFHYVYYVHDPDSVYKHWSERGSQRQ